MKRYKRYRQHPKLDDRQYTLGELMEIYIPPTPPPHTDPGDGSAARRRPGAATPTGGGIDKNAEPEHSQEQRAPWFVPYPTPVKATHLWARWGRSNGNDERVKQLVAFGWALLREMEGAINQWIDVATLLDVRGFEYVEWDWDKRLRPINEAMNSIRDALIPAFTALLPPEPSPTSEGGAGAPPPPSSPQENT